ncbi:DUF6542 domain-containing protein [Corynebacterium sp. H130]|uniref:DUF6542 domain-containing protein n=1 Tax=Corynebacterium sp. H130 TaxID=3133444 RepID=UPI0030A3D7F9
MPKPTTSTPRTRRAVSPTRARGLSLGTALSINVAALLTGLLLSVSQGQFNWIFVLCYGLGAIITTLFVRLGGLFLNVATHPILFGLFTPLTAWWIAKSNLSGGADQWSKTMILSALYPLAQYFPHLAIITLVTIVVALVRWRGAKSSYEQQLQMLERQRRRAARSERMNRQTTTRVREMSYRPRRTEDPEAERVPFSELIKDVNSRADRRRADRQSARKVRVEKPARPRENPQERPARRSFNDDLYS